MLIYNITVNVEKAIAEDWLRWMQTVHGPELVATQCFTRFTLLRLLDIDDTDGPTYAVQCYADTQADYQRFMDEFADTLTQKSENKWGQRIFTFSTLMEVLK